MAGYGSQTLTAGAPGRGFRRDRNQELYKFRRHDLPGGINLHLQIMGLRGGR
jgi:hypothetical protein